MKNTQSTKRTSKGFRHEATKQHHHNERRHEQHAYRHNTLATKNRMHPTQKPQKQWLWGLHSVQEALLHRAASIRKIYVMAAALEKLHIPPTIPVVKILAHEWPALLAKHYIGQSYECYNSHKGADGPREHAPIVHQGVLAEVDPLRICTLTEFLNTAAKQESCLVVALDHITDPHNLGAIARSACVFGAQGLINTTHNSAPINGFALKAAAGALERLQLIEALNLRQTLEDLKKEGFWIIGLDECAPEWPTGTIDAHHLIQSKKLVLVIGSEGVGLRRLTKESCDGLYALPAPYKKTPETHKNFTTLNASAAATFALGLLHINQRAKDMAPSGSCA